MYTQQVNKLSRVRLKLMVHRHTGSFKFTHNVYQITLLADILKGKVYATCIRSCLMHGSETWPMKVEHELKMMNRTEMSMIRWMCGIKLNETKKSEELRELLGLEPVSLMIKKSMLRWFGRVERNQVILIGSSVAGLWRWKVKELDRQYARRRRGAGLEKSSFKEK